MTRALVGLTAGAAAGLLVLAAGGAMYGYTEGLPTARVPPGLEAAVKTAFIVSVYFGWVAAPLGAIVGGLASVASGLVAPRGRRSPHSTTPTAAVSSRNTAV